MSGLNEELDGLEQSIRKLQIEWEKFFGGVERKPPVDFATRVERLIRRYAAEPVKRDDPSGSTVPAPSTSRWSARRRPTRPTRRPRPGMRAALPRVRCGSAILHATRRR